MWPQQRTLLPDDVYEDLLGKITSGHWKVDERIPSESLLCKEYSVSRVSIRSALQRLQALNLIVTKPGKGSYVYSNSIGENLFSNVISSGQMDLSENEYRYIVELRNALEFKSIDLMVSRGTEEDLEKLKSHLEEMKQSAHDIDAYVLADYNFHMALIKGSHNPLFVTVMEGCKEYFIKYFKEMARVSAGRYEKPLENHTRIYKAMYDRDAESAKQ
ncbi:MAG: FadR/GntR family transcriptional regulator, partial [Sphaerochaetaceae bacterium]